MVARDGEPLLLEGYGTADRDDQVPATPQTLFHLGSVTKQFTAAAILKLEIEGKLRVSDSIAEHLEGVPPDKRAITIHHLLTHTSGLPGRSYPCSAVENLSRDEHVRRVFAAELKSPPGARHSYSNEGYSLLGAIIETASGRSYEQYLREHLFEPAGMTSTGYTFSESERARAARGYEGDEEYVGYLNPTEIENGPAWCGRSSGALLSTAEDMYRWHVALRGSDVLSAQAKEKMFTSHVPESPEGSSFYGYGWALFTTPRGTKLAAHNGSINDYFTADLRWYVDEGIAILVAGNAAEQSATSAARGVARTIFPPQSDQGQ